MVFLFLYIIYDSQREIHFLLLQNLSAVFDAEHCYRDFDDRYERDFDDCYDDRYDRDDWYDFDWLIKSVPWYKY